MIRKSLATLAQLIMLVVALTSCTNELFENPGDEQRNKYTVEWVKRFGPIDPNQDWNMAERITANVDPESFGPGYTLKIYTDKPSAGGALIAEVTKSTTLHLDVLKNAKSLYARAYTPDGTQYVASTFAIDNKREAQIVNMRSRVGEEITISRADPEEYVNPQWIIACEDLGSIGDYDFNDIVLGINYVKKDDDTTGDLTVIGMAAGGNLGANVYYGDSKLFEIHKFWSHNERPTGSYAMYNTMTWGGAGEVVLLEDVDFTITDKMGSIKIEVLALDGNKVVETIVEAPSKGGSEAPQMICVPGKWWWPKETQDITAAYPDFDAWNKNADYTTWDNHLSSTNNVVVRPRPATAPNEDTPDESSRFVGYTTDGAPYTAKVEGVEYQVQSGEVFVFAERTPVAHPTTCVDMFYGERTLKSMDISNMYMGNVTSMRNMFASCSGIESITFAEDIDTSNVTDMHSVFEHCGSLASIDVSGFDTSDVEDFGCIFSDCGSLASIDVSNFDTSKAKDMSCMFNSCSELSELDVTNFDTSKSEDMSYMFNFCTSLESLDVTNFDTSRVKNMSRMFCFCSILESLDVTNFVTSSAEDMGNMFMGLMNVGSLDVSNFDTSKVKDMQYMFGYCCNIERFDLSNFDTANVKNMEGMFTGCSGMTELNLSSFDTFSVTNMSYMFADCYSIQQLDINGFDTSNVVNFQGMFSGDYALSSLELSNFDTSSAIDMSYMFASSIGLMTLDLSNFDTSNVIYMSGMFKDCRLLTSIDVSSFNTSATLNMHEMFSQCYILPELDLTSFNTSNATDMSKMFYECQLLENIYVSSGWTTSQAYASDMFWNCPTQGVTVR